MYSSFPVWYVCKVDSSKEKMQGYTLLSFKGQSLLWMGFSKEQDDFGNDNKIQSSPKNLAKKLTENQNENYNAAFNYTPPIDTILLQDFPCEGKATFFDVKPLENKERTEFENALEKLASSKN